jgi:hypothetical protein
MCKSRIELHSWGLVMGIKLGMWGPGNVFNLVTESAWPFNYSTTHPREQVNETQLPINV